MCLIKENLVAGKTVISENDFDKKIHRQKIPKLSRKIVRSAKVNLNRYWRAFHELFAPETYQKSHYNNSGEPLLNNEIDQPVKIQPETNEISDYLSKHYNYNYANEYENNASNLSTGKYLDFSDENLYNGVNLNYEIMYLNASSSCPCSCHQNSLTTPQINNNRFSINVMENIEHQEFPWIV